MLFVDDHRVLAESLALCIELEPDMTCAGCLHTADHLAEEVEKLRPDVVLLDLMMPGKEPLEALREVKGTRVIVFSGRDDQETLASAAAAGASGFLSKGAEILVMLEAIRAVAREDAAFRVWK